MGRTVGRSIVGVLVVLALTGAQKNPDKIEGWSEVIDPAGDCQITPGKGGTLTIKVPGTLHDLSREFEDMTAPRVLQDVEGDFVAEVKVAGPMGNHGKRTSRHYLSYHGAGLLLWVDDQTYMRLERCVITGGRQGTKPYLNWDLREGARNQGTHAGEAPDEPMTLRLERRGGQICGAFSLDGKAWTDLKPWEVAFPSKLKIGVAAVSTSDEPLTVRLEKFRVRPAEPNQ